MHGKYGQYRASRFDVCVFLSLCWGNCFECVCMCECVCVSGCLCLCRLCVGFWHCGVTIVLGVHVGVYAVCVCGWLVCVCCGVVDGCWGCA